MKRVRLTDLNSVRELTVEEQALTRGGLSSLAIALLGMGIYYAGAKFVSWGYKKGLNNAVKNLFKTAGPTQHCITWSDGDRWCHYY